ncbi:MAG: D-alanyl-D-alanine carboxypeptidase/D-alanyl-D-alanine-endopeptidase [Pseudomonadota bacterium]|nr:D-alanyl-D-alanine carboxypeptidase/D-alanyl-D-alanine-endopeptidase [Xanthomonadaceae bacterium]MDE3210631.1 D-alanyl-D-alanine carboxypeptidase/D-alanyl-D-alanine-endopeptidase [Pseudomonadota bacterium]
MRRAIPLTLIVASLFLVAMVAKAAAPANAGVASRAALVAQIDAAIGQPRFAAARWGIAVVSLDHGDTLYARNAGQLLQPASTAKLYTAALSLAALGADYRIPTRLLATGPLSHGRLNSPLLLYGFGDPTLGTAGSVGWADQLAAQAAARGLRVVRGDLIADDSYFTGPAHGSGWELDDILSAFAVPASALSVGENVVRLTVSPAPRPGQPARLQLDPAAATPVAASRLLTAAAGTRNDIHFDRASGQDTLQAFGRIAADAPAQRFVLSVADPARLAGRQLRDALKRHGIRITGRVRVLHWPQGDAALMTSSELLGEVWSPPVGEILRRGLKRSQNLYLQNLLLTVGARERTATPGFSSAESRGLNAMRQILDATGIAPSTVLLSEGSGLSRRDLVTPEALVRLLVYLAHQPQAQVLRDALPIAGVDGTLIHRMRGTAAEDNVHAKTGSMSYVSSLAGYVTSASGEHLAFAIILNNYQRPPHAPPVSSDIDAIAVLLANYRGAR